jgi:TRAP-type C4-dicarboxylate transport system permease large subunit
MGLVIVMTCALGLATPPHAVCLLIAAKIADVHPRDTMVITMLFCGVGVLVILLAIFVPNLTLLLPRLLMGRYFDL